MKALLSNPWVITTVCGVVIAFVFRPQFPKDRLAGLAEDTFVLDLFRYTINLVTRKRLRSGRRSKLSADQVDQWDVLVDVVNTSNTASRPQSLEAALVAADGRRFPLVRMSGPAFRANIFPGEGAQGTFSFHVPASVVLTQLDLRDTVVNAEKSIAIRHERARP